MNLAAGVAFGSTLLAGGMAVAMAFQERRSTAAWLFMGGMLVLAVESVFTGLASQALDIFEAGYWQGWALLAMSCLPGPWLAFSLAYARGNSKEFLRKWRFGLAVAFVLPPSLGIAFQLLPGGSLLRDPNGTLQFALGPYGTSLYLSILLASILILMNLERTFRASVGTMRWRIKFMILGLGVLFTVRAYVSSQSLLFHATDLSFDTLNTGALLVACLLILRSVFRTRHFEVHVYPSQAVLQNSLTVMLAGLYLVIVGALAKLVTLVGGVGAFPAKAFLILVFLVLLSVVLLSDRVRLYTKRFVSRHFQRPYYDYRTVWRTFTEGTARCVESTELSNAVVKLAAGLFQALAVTIWLTDERKEKLVFAASTSLSASRAHGMKLDSSQSAHLIQGLSHLSAPVDIDVSKEPWAAALRELHPDEFHKGGNRICVPLQAGGELLGILILGDRVGGLAFSLQDIDLLKAVGDQAAASLLNMQLSQRLSQGKQLEAFQAMSAFFVHDLKNTASTLSLMLQNLPLHYQDPHFREDALRGISKTVTHINELIDRLGVLRHELAIHAVECDLNQLVVNTLNGQAQLTGIELLKELGPLPRLKLDPAQIEKVLTNLVLNASEAVGPHGQVKVQTVRRNGWVVLAVADNGCGMSPEFIENRLFRPFQTTKKKGIGIGMFHCKMIVEAHRGRIEVESEPGKGTAFRVLLPVAASEVTTI
jgi:putative PEP-CTERM system histidine kinase